MMKFFEKPPKKRDLVNLARLGTFVLLSFFAQNAKAQKSQGEGFKSYEVPPKEYLSQADKKQKPAYSGPERIYGPMDGDPVIARQQELKNNPDLIKKAQEEMTATVKRKREQGEARIPVDQLAQYRAETELLLTELRYGLMPSSDNE